MRPASYDSRTISPTPSVRSLKTQIDMKFSQISSKRLQIVVYNVFLQFNRWFL